MAKHEWQILTILLIIKITTDNNKNEGHNVCHDRKRKYISECSFDNYTNENISKQLMPGHFNV